MRPVGLMLLAYAVALIVPIVALRQAFPLPEGLLIAGPPAEVRMHDLDATRRALDLARTPEALARAAEARLAASGFAVFRQAVPPDSNLVGVLPGLADPVILLVAPLESRDPAGGRAAAAVLEAARTLSGKTTATLAVLLEGGSRQAHRGAAEFAKTYRDTGRIIAALGIGPLPDGPCALEVGSAGQPAGYAPIWLRRTALDLAAAEEALLADPAGPAEWLARAGGRSTGAHGPLLAARVPSVTYGCGQSGYASANMRLSSANPVLRASRLAVRFARTLDGADPSALADRGAVTVSADAAVPEKQAQAALGMAFLPLWMGATLALARSGRKPGALRRSLGGFAVRLAPLLAALLALWALPRWGGWPASPPSLAPDLELPPLRPLLFVILAYCATWLALGPARRFFAGLAGDRRAYLRSMVPAELLALALCSGYALAVNPFAAATLLLPAAWLWPLAVGGPGSAILTLLGGTGVMTLAAGAGIVTGLDWRIAPYFLETLAAGGWTAAAAVAGVLALGAGAGGLARGLR